MARHQPISALIAIVVLVLSGCAPGASETDDSPSAEVVGAAISAPVIPFSAPDVINPLRGQFQNLGIGLFPQANAAQSAFPPWPGTFDASIRLTWRALQTKDPRDMPADASDEQRFDFSPIDDAMAAAGPNSRITLRVNAYASCCDPSYPNNINTSVPDWLTQVPGATDTRADSTGLQHIVPNWNSAAYLDYFSDLLAALGRRYDRDERLSVFEFSGYGDFSENHNAFARDELGLAGPDLADSEAVLGYKSQFGEQTITRRSIDRLVEANLSAFPNTQIVTSPVNPEIVRQLLVDAPEADGLRHPVGIRFDCLGVSPPGYTWATKDDSVYMAAGDPLIQQLFDRVRTAPVITEWCQLPDGVDQRAYFEQAMNETNDYHVSMTASTGFPGQHAETQINPEYYALWAKINKIAGYRYTVSTGTIEPARNHVSVDVSWTNHGVASTHEDWRVGYILVNATGEVVRKLDSDIALGDIVADQPLESVGADPPVASRTETLQIDIDGLPAGEYALSTAVTWHEHKPDGTHTVSYAPMSLARPDRDRDGRYPLAVLNISTPVG